jgi:hypothetical protein
VVRFVPSKRMELAFCALEIETKVPSRTLRESLSQLGGSIPHLKSSAKGSGPAGPAPKQVLKMDFEVGEDENKMWAPWPGLVSIGRRPDVLAEGGRSWTPWD